MPNLPIKRNKLFPSVFLATGLTVQVIAYLWMPDNPWSLVSGLLGICSVILCSEGNILTFFFGFGQILTYTYLCYLERFYAGIAMNAFYFGSQIYGIYAWRKRLLYYKNSPSLHIRTRSLRRITFAILLPALALCSWGTGWMLAQFTNDSQPYFDAFTTVPAIAAQVLMVTAYKEQWYLWLLIDVLYVAMWAGAGNACMVMQYTFWCANCLYGLVRWQQTAEQATT